MNSLDIVKAQLVYWVKVGGGAILFQDGMGLLTYANPAPGIHNLTMPANFKVPSNRRSLCLTAQQTGGGAPTVNEDVPGSTDTVISIDTAVTNLGVTTFINILFDCKVYRMLALIGGGVG